jgi:hypothetical protein
MTKPGELEPCKGLTNRVCRAVPCLQVERTGAGMVLSIEGPQKSRELITEHQQAIRVLI